MRVATFRWGTAWAVVALLSLAAGCGFGTGTVAWSPDGTRGVYGVIDTDAKPVRADWFALSADGTAVPVGAEIGFFVPFPYELRPVAWSADSRSLYFVRHAAAGGPAELCRRRDGQTTPVATLGPVDVIDVCVSPDERWVATVTAPPGTLTESGKSKTVPDGQRPPVKLVVVGLSDGSVRTVAEHAGPTACFTGPGRLAYVEQGDPTWAAELGQVVEAAMDRPGEKPTPVAGVLVDATFGLRPTPDGLLFVSVEATFPFVPSASSTSRPADLFHWTRATRQLKPIVDRVVYYDLSPDGTRVLFTALDDGDKPVGGVVRPDGSDRHRFADPDLAGRCAVLPAWRGNDHVTAPSAVGVERPAGNGTRTTYDLVDYAVSADGRLTAGRVLSAGWPDERKPSELVYRPPQSADPSATRPTR